MPCNHPRARNLAELREITRRQLFETCGIGVGKIALASLLVGGGRALAGEATTQPAPEAATQAAPDPAPVPASETSEGCTE